MADCAHTWRKKLRLQELMAVAKREIDAGEKIDPVYETLEDQMQARWRFVGSTGRQYMRISRGFWQTSMFWQCRIDF